MPRIRSGLRRSCDGLFKWRIPAPDPVDILELRRKILANLDSDYIGFNKYWSGE